MRGSETLNDAIADLRAMGAPDDVIESLAERQRGDSFEVWPENEAIVLMFLRLETQWRVGFGGRIGMDYTAAKWLFEVYAVDDPRRMLEGLMVMERAALAAIEETQQ